MGFQKTRQTELFAGQNWQVAFEAFSQVSFKAFDFDSIRQELINYIQRNFPEDFNDWIQNQELIFIIDLLAYLGQSLSFRVELNSRENFLDTAERRESVLKLARQLGLTPKRNFPARGLLKLQKVKTNESVVDSNGIDLANIDILWNDPASLDWFERFILILNSAFISSNTFGQPVKEGTVGTVNTQLYRINSVPLVSVVEPFTANVNGQSMRFEITNPDFEDDGFFFERNPDPLDGKHLIFRNDGAGNASPNTGFFTFFKQGILSFSDFEFAIPQENRIIDIDIDGINELDVFVQEVNDTGLIVEEWTKVPAVENIAFNSIQRQIREIFSVLSKDNDQISIRFGDGRFGKSPTGIFRVWHRTSNGLVYQIRPSDMQNIPVVVTYTKTNENGAAQKFSLTLTFGLEYTIDQTIDGGSVPRETAFQVKNNAPQVYYTQNRMINGEDYNVFPLQFANVIRKVKALNRIYSGQSRFIETNDPTSRTQNTKVFSDDGIIYKEEFQRSDFEPLPTSKTSLEIFETKIAPLLLQIDINDFFYTNFPRQSIFNAPDPVQWFQASEGIFSSTGEFRSDPDLNNIFDAQPIGVGTPNNYPFLKEGALVKFRNPINSADILWAKIEQVEGDGTDPNIETTGLGPVVLNEEIPLGWEVVEVIPAFRQTLTTLEIDNVIQFIEDKQTFALRFDTLNTTWETITTNNISLADFSLAFAGDTTETNKDSSWLLQTEFQPSQSQWKFTTRNLRYVWESVEDVRFFFVNDFKVVDIQRRTSLRDIIKVLKFNSEPSPSSVPLTIAYDWSLVNSFLEDDGFIQPRRVQISFPDIDNDGVPDNPDIFDIIVDPLALEPGSSLTDRYIFQQTIIGVDGFEESVPVTNVIAFLNAGDITLLNLLVGEVAFVIDTGEFFERQFDESLLDVSVNFKAFVGRNDLNFQWKHFAPEDHRIDPAKTNLIDMFILTEAYNQSVRKWLATVNRPTFPTPPSIDDLRIQFAELQKFKAVSDELILRTARFKLLFGSEAKEELQAQFKVIKVAGTDVSDNEIKQRVVAAINEFFNVDLWTFGETFNYTELAAFIHQQLATIVASIVIVPKKASSKFGELFIVRSESDQLFLSTAAVGDIVIVDNYTMGNIKIGS